MRMHTSLRDGADNTTSKCMARQLSWLEHMVHTHGVEGSTPPLATDLVEASDFSEAFFVVENFVEKGYDFILLCGKMIKNTAERP